MIDEDEVEDALFWANLHGITRVVFKTLRQWLANGGYVPPADPPDDRVSAELNTLLDRLADLGVVVEFADHLSDRELYSWLLESDNSKHTSRRSQIPSCISASSAAAARKTTGCI